MGDRHCFLQNLHLEGLPPQKALEFPDAVLELFDLGGPTTGSSAEIAERPPSCMSFRHRNRTPGAIPHRRATAETLIPEDWVSLHILPDGERGFSPSRSGILAMANTHPPPVPLGSFSSHELRILQIDGAWRYSPSSRPKRVLFKVVIGFCIFSPMVDSDSPHDGHPLLIFPLYFLSFPSY